MSRKVCISGYYGFDNFGDEIILKILAENLKKFDNPPEITVFSSNPIKTSSKIGVKCVQTFNLKDIIKSIFLCDCLISGGGSLLQDATSSKSLIYYLFVIILALFFRKRVIIFAQGIGPIKNKFLRKLTAFAISKAALVTVRDNNSLKLLENWNIKAIKCSDPAWNLNVEKFEKNGRIGVQLRNHPNINDIFIDKLAFCLNKYYKNKEINILSLQNNIDMEICNKLKKHLLDINPKINVSVIKNISEESIIENICNLEELIAMRYHACLVAIKAGIKLLPVAYDIKVKAISEEFNIKYITLEEQENIDLIFREYIKNKIEYNEEKINNLKFDFKLIEKLI